MSLPKLSKIRTYTPGDNTPTLSKEPPFRFEVPGESPMATVNALVMSEGVFVVCGGPQMVPLTKALSTVSPEVISNDTKLAEEIYTFARSDCSKTCEASYH